MFWLSTVNRVQQATACFTRGSLCMIYAGLLHLCPIFNKGLVVKLRFSGDELKVALRHPYLYLTSLHPYPHPTPRSHPGRPPPLAYKRNLPLIMFVSKPRAPSAYPRLIPPRPLTDVQSPPCYHSLASRTTPTTTRFTSPPPSPRA